MLAILPNLRATPTPQRRRTAPSASRPPARAGFTIIEIIMVVVLASAIYVIALPAIGRTRVSASLHNARHVVVSSVSLARATAIRYGRTAVLQLDSAEDLVWIEADTTLTGSGADPYELGRFSFAEELGVNLKANRSRLCFNSRGIGTTTAACPLTGAVIVVTLNGHADTVRVSPTGRVLP